MQSKMKLGAISLFVLGAACNSGGANMPEVGSEGTATGKIGVSIHEHLQNGANLTALSWAVTNTVGTLDDTGTVNIGSASGVAFVAGGIIADPGYVLTLTGSDSLGDVCYGQTTGITVTPEAVTDVIVAVTCEIANDAGTQQQGTTDAGSIFATVNVNTVAAAPFVCPVLTNFSIADAYIQSGGTTALTETSTAGSGGTQTLLWSVDNTSSTGGATITNPATAAATLNCNAYIGNVTVTFYTGLDAAPIPGSDAGTPQECPTNAANTQQVTVFCDYTPWTCTGSFTGSLGTYSNIIYQVAGSGATLSFNGGTPVVGTAVGSAGCPPAQPTDGAECSITDETSGNGIIAQFVGTQANGWGAPYFVQVFEYGGSGSDVLTCVSP